MTGVDIPHWFDIDRYELGNTGEEGMHEAMLAVLDRVAFYRIAVDLRRLSEHPAPLPLDRIANDPASGDAKVRQALQRWSEHPYCRADEETRVALLDALPAAPGAFETLLEDAEADERDASQRGLHQIVDGVAHLPPDGQWQAVEEEVGRLRKWQEQDGDGVDLLKPADFHRVEKLLRYRAAAYMDLTIWGALVGNTPSARDLEQAHLDLWPDGPDWRSIARLLEQLKDRDLGFHTRLDEGGVFRGGLRNARRRK